MKSKKVFISGGSGVIGKELVKILLDKNFSIFVGDLKACPEEFKGKVKYRKGDLNFINPIEIQNFKPEIFFHLAATFERSTENYDFWEENYWNNVKLTHHLLSIIKDLNSVKKIIFASSYLIYEPNLYQFNYPQEKPIFLSEEDPIYPRNLTGAAKFCHEIDLRFINQFKSKKMNTICARIFRGYGCDSRDVISRWIRDLINEKTISVYREEGIFDYIYSKDSAMGLFKISEIENYSGIINLGTGKPRKVSEIIDILKKHFPAMSIHKEEADIAFEASSANINLLQSKTKWKPKFDLEQSIPEIIKFEKRRILIKNNNKNQKLVVLITSAGKKTSMIDSVKKAINKISHDAKLIVGDSSDINPGMYMADDFWRMDLLENYKIELLINELLIRGINFIIPSRDGELDFWSRNKNILLENGIFTLISPKQSINNCLDKKKFAEFCLTYNFKCIETYDDLEDLNFEKYVVKERFGSGSSSIGINLNKINAKNHAKSLRNPIFQEYIIGQEISIDAWVDNKSNIKGIILRKRDYIENGESKITTTFQDKNIERIARDLLQRLNLTGPIVLQAILSDKYGLLFMECNPRFGGGSTLSINVGLDSFYWSILESKGEDIERYQFYRSPKEIRQIRVSSNLYTEINDNYI